jgi:hypothetical protein
MTQHRPPPLPQQRGELGDQLVALAGTPDDHSGVEDLLVAIAQLTARRVEAVSYASVTARNDGSYTTVAVSHEIATAVDEAQYADGSGPCVDALESGRPLPVPNIVTTMRWPRFRETAYRLGLHTSLSIPLFAGGGEPIAALNLYGHDPSAMTALTSAVWATFDDASPLNPDLPLLDPGGIELVEGLTEAFAVRAKIQQAVGILIARQGGPSESAYAELRLHAADAGTSLLDAATGIITAPRG